MEATAVIAIGFWLSGANFMVCINQIDGRHYKKAAWSFVITLSLGVLSVWYT